MMNLERMYEEILVFDYHYVNGILIMSIMLFASWCEIYNFFASYFKLLSVQKFQFNIKSQN